MCKIVSKRNRLFTVCLSFKVGEIFGYICKNVKYDMVQRVQTKLGVFKNCNFVKAVYKLS